MWTFLSQGFEPLPTQMAPLYYFEISIFDNGPLFFLRVPSAPILRVEHAPKKHAFFGQNFSKVIKKALFGLFKKNFACGSKWGLYSGLAEHRKPIWSTYKKSRQNFYYIF